MSTDSRDAWRKLFNQANTCKTNAISAKETAKTSKHLRDIRSYIKSLDSKIRHYKFNMNSGTMPPMPASDFFECKIPEENDGRLSSRLNQLKETNGSDILLKSPKDWTEAELKEAMKAREKASSQDKQDMMMREREWFEHYYGTEPIKFDETGKMIQPSPARPLPNQSQPIRTKDGTDLNEAIDQIVALLPQKGDEPELIKGVQSGLNILTNKQNQSPLPNTPKTAKLKEDGIAGPKTALGLKKALLNKGTAKVSEALALGQFKETVKKAKKDGPQNLADELGATFSPLLPKNKSPKDGFQPEGLVLQDTLNDLGAVLKDDGNVGPKTEAAFGQIAKSKDEDELVNQFGYNLGFEF